MTSTDHQKTGTHVEKTFPARATETYSLTLFVSGASKSSAHAVADVRVICDAHLSGRHELVIVDLNQEPTETTQHHVLATPSLVKTLPLPVCVLVGDLSDHLSVLRALDVTAAAAGAAITVHAAPS